MAKSWLTAQIGYNLRWLLALMMVFGLIACAASPTGSDPIQAQASADAAWQAYQHVIWQIDWPAAPVGGMVVVETWRAGPRYRYEILEAAAPALLGEVLVSDGRQVGRYNRFENLPNPSLLQGKGEGLAPVTDAFALIDRLLAVAPQSAAVEPAQLPFGPAAKITLTYANGDTLTLWRDDKTGLPARITLVTGSGQSLTLTARSLDLFNNPPEELFGVVQ